MPLYEVIVDFTQTRSIRKLIEADDPQAADDHATAELNGAAALCGWEEWGETRERPEIVSTERVARRDAPGSSCSRP